MAYKVVWSPASIADLRTIVGLIAEDNPDRAQTFGFQLLSRVDVLADHPEIGSRVLEHASPRIRRLILKPYRIVYRVDH